MDILIEGDIYPSVMLEGVRKNLLGNLMAQESIFGWVLTVSLRSNSYTNLVSCCT